ATGWSCWWATSRTTESPASSAFPRAAPSCRGRSTRRGSSSASWARARSTACPEQSGRIGTRREGSIRFPARQFDHLGPLLGFGREQLGEIGGGAGQRRAAEFGNPCLHLGVGEGGVEFAVERLDDGGGRAGGRGDAIPRARLVARQKIPHGRKLRHRLRTR